MVEAIMRTTSEWHNMQTQASAPAEVSGPTLDAPAGGASPRRRYIWLALLAAGPLILLILLRYPSLDRPLLHDPLIHLVITLVGSLLGVFLALLVLNVARRAQDGRLFLIGMGFLSVASIFITHSISTPDVLMSGRGLATGISGLVSLVLGGIFFALSGLHMPLGFNHWLMRHVRLWLLAFLIFWLAYNWVFLVMIPAIAVAQEAGSVAREVDAARPHGQAHAAGSAAAADAPSEDQAEYEPAQPPAPPTSSNFLGLVRGLLVTIGFVCYILAIGRHYAFYRRSRSQAGFGLTCGMAFFGEALLTQYFAQLYAYSFWLYHIQEFTGYAVISYAVLGAYRRGLNDESLLESLLLPGTRARLQAGYARAMEALVEALSRGQQPTPALRQALRARFGLAESQVRVLEEAATAVTKERRQRQELELLNQSVRQLEAHKEQLTQMIVHDLKNPLTALLGFLELLRLDHLTDDQRVLLENALRSGRNLSDLIGDLLDIGRIEEGRLELERVVISPSELLVECAAEMRGWLAQENKTIAVEASADLPPLYADYRLLRRVMLNLLSNAIKHTPASTHISLRASPSVLASSRDRDGADIGQIVIEVEDNGPGIPSIYLERIFDKFGRFAVEQTALQSSTGLGLTLCRLVIEAHGGTVGVTSTVGQGTIFQVALPVATMR
jgi:signal transduction histidine kinase